MGEGRQKREEGRAKKGTAGRPRISRMARMGEGARRKAQGGKREARGAEGRALTAWRLPLGAYRFALGAYRLALGGGSSTERERNWSLMKVLK